METEETFGNFLKKCRLRAGYGLRSFALMIDMKPSNLSNIEHGRLNPPQDPEALTQITETLGLVEDSIEWLRLFDLAVKHKSAALPPDVASYAGKTPGIPVLLRTIKGKKLTQKDLRELTSHINEQYMKK